MGQKERFPLNSVKSVLEYTELLKLKREEEEEISILQINHGEVQPPIETNKAQQRLENKELRLQNTSRDCTHATISKNQNTYPRDPAKKIVDTVLSKRNNKRKRLENY